jgi:signal transduction histidine kinase
MMLWWPGQRSPVYNQALAHCTEAAFGCSAAELGAALEPDVLQVMQTGQALELQDAAQRLPRRPGSSTHQPCCLHPLQGEHGRTQGVLLIGALSQMQAGWRERMDYAAVIYAMDLGFCRIEMLEPVEGELRDYRYLETNPAYETHSGLRDVVGRRISEVTQQREPYWPRTFESVLVSGQTLHTTVTLRSTDQSFETWIMRLGGPGSRQLAVLLKNVTEQVHAEQRLKQSEYKAQDAARRAEIERNRLAAMVEATPAAVLVIDRQQRTTLANSTARQLWGDLRARPSPRWVGRWADGGPRQGQPLRGSQWPLVRALRGQTVREVLEITSPANGQSRGIFLVSAEPTRDSDGAIDGAVVVALDISERVLAEQALQNANRRKDEFLAMLAHELRNPLAPIAMAAEMLGRADTAPESMADTSAVITRQVRHMRGLIDDLLDASRFSRGLIEIDSQELDLRPLVHEAVEQVRPMLQSLSHALQLQLPPHRLSVRGDDKRLVQILSNLLHNAAKYTPAGGHIHIGAEIDADTVQVRVSDNGIGMDRRTLEHAFELFSQAERGVDRHQGGCAR